MMTGPIMRDQAAFVVELEKFSGPLDLLLHLIKEDEVDITDLDIGEAIRVSDLKLPAGVSRAYLGSFEIQP